MPLALMPSLMTHESGDKIYDDQQLLCNGEKVCAKIQVEKVKEG